MFFNGMSKKGFYSIMFYALGLGIFLLDRITKLVVVHNLHIGQSIPVIKNIFHFTYITNSGAAFGIFPESNFFFIIVSLIGVGIVFSLHRKLEEEELFLDVALGCILGGILGNLVDRLVIGEVVDFLDFRIWPVFNVADSSICIGVCVIFWALIFKKAKK